MSAGEGFYDQVPVAQVAINLFYGWGYNFYRVENQLRADDLLVRARACELLGAARAGLEAAEAGYRREFLPPPSRAQPRPDPLAVARAQAIEALGRELGSLEGQIRALPVPEADRMTQRLRHEAATLARLVALDQALIGHAARLRAQLAAATGAWVADNLAGPQAHLAAIRAAIQDRRDLLAG